jgi:hypothetical protein
VGALSPNPITTEWQKDGSLVLRQHRPWTPAERTRWKKENPGATTEDVLANKVPGPFLWTSPTHPRPRHDINALLFELQAWPAANDADGSSGGFSSVRLTVPGEVSPSTLHRFPWNRMLAAADAAVRLRAAEDGPFAAYADLADEFDDSLRGLFGAVPHRRRGRRGKTPGRPGRRGHPDGHYQWVATAYMQLREQGVSNPTTTIAEEHNYNRSTVAGWISEARKRGYLPPARRGRPG